MTVNIIAIDAAVYADRFAARPSAHPMSCDYTPCCLVRTEAYRAEMRRYSPNPSLGRARSR